MNTVVSFLVQHWQRLPLRISGTPPRLASVVMTPRFRASSHVIFFILADGQTQPLLVVKVPRLPGDNSRLDREAANLQMVHTARAGGFHSIPRVVAYEDYRDSRLLIETALVGQTMTPVLVRRQPQACIEAVLAWLIDLHIETSTCHENGKEWFSCLVERPLDCFESSFPLSDEEKRLLDQTRELITPLRDADVTAVFEHGDLSAPNILIAGAASLGVVDWELAEPQGLPALDLFFFLTFVAFARRRARQQTDCLAAFHEAFFGPRAWAWPYVIRYAAKLQLSSEVLKPLFIVCWSRYVTNIVMRLHDLSSWEGLEEETATWLRTNRYYALWRHTVRHVQELYEAS
jgi:aminoglycoside phosphotransferase (APT) family kinase protein